MDYKLPKPPEIKIKTKQPDKRHFCVIPTRVLRHNLTSGLYKTLIALASYCNKSGFSYVSLEKIGQDLGITKQTVSYHMKKLEKLNIVKTYPNYYPTVKGSTRRIIYDDSINDEDAQAISGEPKEPYTNIELRQLAREKHHSKNNSLNDVSKRLKSDESRLSDREIIARLKSSVSNALDKAMIQRDYEQGIPLDIIKARYIKA